MAEPRATGALERFLFPAVFLSGAAAVLYEVLWMRALSLRLGAGAAAACAVLSLFMAGMAAGGWLLGRRADRGGALRLFAALEGGLALYALLTPFMLSFADSGWAVLWLLPPAVAMGGTIPVLCAASRLRGAEAVGPLAFWNTLGGALGAAVGFWLVAGSGLVACFVGAGAANLAAAALALSGAGAGAGTAPIEDAAGAPDAKLGPAAWVLLAGCGAAALAFEALWTRLLSLVLGSTAQAFAAILAVFLVGLALGGRLAPVLARRVAGRFAAMGWLEMGAGAAALGALAVFPRLIEAYLGLYAATGGPGTLFTVAQLLLAGGALIVPAVLMGAVLPLASEAARRGGGPGGSVGALFALNAAGAAAGPWAVYIAVPALGLGGAAAALSGAFAALGLVGTAVLGQGRSRWVGAAAAGALAAASLAVPRPSPAVLHSAPAVYANEILQAKVRSAGWRERVGDSVVFARDGREASVAVWRDSGGSHYLTIDGKVDSSERVDLGTQLLLGHLPILLSGEPAGGRALVVGLGSGATAAAVARHGFSTVEAVEIEPEVAAAAPYFARINRGVLGDPRVSLILGDARRVLRSSAHRYRLIVSEPSNPWIAGMSHLFTAEFYALVRGRLAPGGAFCQWLPIYQQSSQSLAAGLATVLRAFPHVTAWRVNGDLLLVASNEELGADWERFARGLESEAVRADLLPLGVRSPSDLLAFRVADQAALSRLVPGAPDHTDARPVLELLAPQALHDRDAVRRNAAWLESSGQTLAGSVRGAGGRERWLTRSLLVVGRIEAAERELASLPADDPWRDGLERDLGRAFLIKGRPARAMAILRRRMARRADSGARLDFARAALEAGRREEALSVLEAYAREAGGGGRLAASVQRARREDRAAPAVLALALAYARRGEGPLAAEVFARGLELDPGLLEAEEGGHVLR